MNNKYDVNNFSKLIDTFDLEKEVQMNQDEINEHVKYMRLNHGGERNQNLFDPVLPYLRTKDDSPAEPDDDEKTTEMGSQKNARSRAASYDPNCVRQCRYEVAKFQGKRFNLEKLSERLLVSPPNRIIQHAYKDEVINYILDKAFVERPLTSEHVEALEQCFVASENREILLKLIESDYRAYELSYLRPQMIEKRRLKVTLPETIYSNVLSIFHLFLNSL